MRQIRTSGLAIGPVKLSTFNDEWDLLQSALAGEWAAPLAALARSGDRPPWALYLARCNGDPVGLGLFKGPPGEDGWVEIAYLTFIPARGGGVATEIARRLVDIARIAGARGVRAHTQPESGSSTRVLEHSGFTLQGEEIDLEDGRVWRWEVPFLE